MLKRYEEFLKEFDNEINQYFQEQQRYIKCHKGCTDCCTNGEYPYSRLEAEYLMQGFQGLTKDARDAVRMNIKQIKAEKARFSGARFMYKCPFLINGLCALYPRRGLTCRMFGLAYLSDRKIVLPECANLGLNYSEVFDKSSGIVNIQKPIKKKLIIDTWLKNEIALKYGLECGEIRPLADWF